MTLLQSETRPLFFRDRKNFTLLALSATAIFMFGPACCLAEVKLPTILSDHMVLQRDMPVPIWGWADPNEEVAVVIAGQTHHTQADAQGNWRVTLEPLVLGDPLTLVVEGKNRLQVDDILVGEVWLCSGQSNMRFEVYRCWNADLEIASAKYPNIRLLTASTPASQTPIKNVDGKWQSCSPKTVGKFSGVGYFFGRQLHQILDVPIGLINNSWGGSSCEAWIRRDRLEGNPMYEALLTRWNNTVKHYESGKARAEFDKVLAKWKGDAAAAKQAGKKSPPKPRWLNPLKGMNRPANLYHGRLQPVLPFAIRGAIWYQGESNARRAYQYREMFPLMIQNWRDDWQQGDFPFYWVQLADFREEVSDPGDSDWAELREAQTMTLDQLPNTGEAVIIDLGEAADIHPRNKVDVAKRLALWALARDYGLDFNCQSPCYESMEVGDGKIILKMKNVHGRLRTVDAREVQGFAIAGEDKKWVWAKAKIVSKDRIKVWSEGVPVPVAVRYAWANNPVCNVYNDQGLPLTPLRTDDWPGATAKAR